MGELAFMGVNSAEEDTNGPIAATQPQAPTDVAFRQLETVRAFAFEELRASDDWATANQRHAEYYLPLAQQTSRALTGLDQRAWLGRLEVEHQHAGRSQLGARQGPGDSWPSAGGHAVAVLGTSRSSERRPPLAGALFGR